MLREELGRIWELKEAFIGPPKIYLGDALRKVELENGTRCWTFRSAQYVKSTVQNVEECLKREGWALPARAPTPLSREYRPELDTSEKLPPDEAAYYQLLVGILQWIVELGRVGLCTGVLMMLHRIFLNSCGF